MKSKRTFRGVGIPCMRCAVPTSMYRHGEGWKPEPGKAHYEFWYICKNADCKTTVFMSPDLPIHLVADGPSFVPASVVPAVATVETESPPRPKRLTRKQRRRLLRQRRTKEKRAKRAGQRQNKKSQWWDMYHSYINSPDWRMFRLKIIAQRGNQCEYCPRLGPGLHLHHLTYARLGKELPEDVRLACEPCHQKQHPHKKITRR